MSVELARSVCAMGIRDQAVLRVVSELPRSRFVPASLEDASDDDCPLPIGYGQTISQPYIVAYMTERLELTGAERVLEIGTGSGYQTAILASLAREVFSIEIIPALASRAAEVLGTFGFTNLHLRVGDGGQGWAEQAPFDRILVTAAPTTVPEGLFKQLAPGGWMIVPVGGVFDVQMLKVVEMDRDGIEIIQDLLPVRFVPMTGEIEGLGL